MRVRVVVRVRAVVCAYGFVNDVRVCVVVVCVWCVCVCVRE